MVTTNQENIEVIEIQLEPGSVDLMLLASCPAPDWDTLTHQEAIEWMAARESIERALASQEDSL